MAIFKGSRYEFTPVHNFLHPQKGLVPSLGRRRLLKLPTNAEVTRYLVVEGDTLDYIAYRLLGDASLWWVILDINDKYMTPYEIKIGDVLLVPTIPTLRRALDEL